jgi:hypothetical protein
MGHTVELHRSVRDNIDKLSPAARQEIMLIVKALEGDRSYCPTGPAYADYIIEQDLNGLRACSHVGIWGYWQLIWYSEASWSNNHVARVVVRLDEIDIQPLKPLRNSL